MSDPNTHHEALAAWFLGPKAENFDILRTCFETLLSSQQQTRLNYFPDDQPFITTDLTTSTAFQASVQDMETKFKDLLAALSTFSIPFFSPRYSAHMCTEISVPAILGYLSAMLGYNPNNVAFEASPVTTLLEIEAGLQICDMFGYTTSSTTNPESVAWGHITCDGTVANLESIWAARNLKFYPLSFRDAMGPGAPLEFIANTFKIFTCKGEEKYMRDLTTWELLNLRVDDILNIPTKLYDQYQISQTFLDNAMSPFIIQTLGKDVLEARWGIKTPQFFVSRTKHYSWPKGAAIAGIGSGNVINLEVDIDARVDVGLLETLLRQCSVDQQPVYSVVVIVGTTEEGAVDSLDEILMLRTALQSELGLSFVVHVDAAWGGYFASMIRPAPELRGEPFPRVPLSPHTVTQFQNIHLADSITIDPHKAGYVPYPAGSLCYRDRRMKNLLVWTAPYLNQGEGESIGIYGVEGSKPGAAATAAWLSHTVIPLNNQNMGSLLGEVSFTCRRFSAHWAAMSGTNTDFIVVPMNLIPAERDPNSTPESIEAQKQYIRDNILPVENANLTDEAMDLLEQLGSDLNINAFACNFKINGQVNTDVDEANYLNRRIFERLSITKPGEDPNTIPFFLTSTVFAQADYGQCATKFKERLGLQGNQDLFVLRNVVMSPFTTTKNFVAQLADSFKQVLQEEMQVVLKRDAMAPDVHQFVVQGSGTSKYLVYQPFFKKLNSCYQVILSANINFTWPDPNVTVFLENKDLATLDTLASADFVGKITVGTDPTIYEVQVTNVKLIKQASLNFNDRSIKYPDSYMPFYLYGTTSECHITHLISLDPNIQLCASNVSILLEPPLSPEALQAGVIVYANGIHEASMQPFPPNAQLPQGDKFFFHPNLVMNVSVYTDTVTLGANHNVQLSHIRSFMPIATGTITLSAAPPYVDNDRINEDPFDFDMTSQGRMNANTASAWKAVVQSIGAK